VTLPDATGAPGSRLVGWQDVSLAPGEHANVTITLSPEDLADLHLLEFWNADADAWTTAGGDYGVAVGGSSDAAISSSFTIE
jgi:beta-glucosidase